jgi:Pvc16 N-terminal domain
MSNFLAIATVTATLSRQLQNVIGFDVPGATVTNQRPDNSGGGTPAPHVNLYLYQVTPNATWRGHDLPTRRSDGTLVQRPQVAFDLHYLLSFYGDEAQLEPQRLLGSVARTLHARPILTQRMIREAIASTTFTFLAASDLAEAVESVKFTPLSLDLEELSKLWSVFLQTPYTLSLAYQASVVLIESDESPQRSLPVRDRNIYVIPLRQPMIESVRSEAGSQQPITIGSTLILAGQNLQNTPTQVRIGDVEVTPDAVSDREIRVSLNSPPFPAMALRAGIQGIQVSHPLLIGTPPVPHRGSESNVAAFVLRPTITLPRRQAAMQRETATDPVTGNAITRCSGNLRVNFTPAVGRNQRVVLLLNPLQATTPPRAYSFAAPVGNGLSSTEETTTGILFPIQQVIADTYLVRVQVDGAESLLTVQVDPDQPDRPDPADPRYIAPQVRIA